VKTFIKWVVLFLAISLCAGYLAESLRGGILFLEKQGKKESESISPEQLARAKTIFNEKCARCHGEDGRGKTVSGDILGVPNFTDEKWWKEEKDDKRFITSVTNGKDGMPAFGKKLSKQEISSLVAYVRRFGKPAH
jgi:cbb3-type cytochrome c oxidase subunit III